MARPRLFSTLAVLAATGCGESPVTIVPGPPGGAALPYEVSLVSGAGQVGKVGERTAEPLVVRVVDRNGEPVGSTNVTWDIPSGLGELVGAGGGRHDDLLVAGGRRSTRTSPEGVARVSFVPLVLGRSVVTASVGVGDAPLLGSPVSFEAEAHTLVISMGYGLHGWIDTGCWSDGWWDGTLELDAFVDVTCSDHTIVPLGAAVEWVNHRTEAARVISTAAPPGGATFDSGTLLEDGRFRFEPRVSGTWEFKNALGEATGMLTVTAPQSSAWLAAEAASRSARR